MTDAETIQYIQRAFGDGWVDVELTDKQLQDCLADAYRWFNDRKGLRCLAGIMLVSGQNEYDVTDLLPPVQTALKLAFPRATDINLRAIYGDDLALPGVPWGMFPYGALQGGVYSSLVQALQYRETASRIMSSDLDWELIPVIDPTTPTAAPRKLLRIFPGVNGPQGQAILEYKATLTSMPQIAAATNARDEDFVLRRAVVAAKQRLGRIRGKYSTLPTARGERTLDGASLLSEAKEELEELNKDLAETNMPIPFITA